MRLPRIAILILCCSPFAYCEKDTGETDVTSAFVEAAQALFNDKEAVGGLQGMASAFMQSGAGQQVNDLLSSSGGGNGAGQLLSGLGSLMAGAGAGRDGDNPFLATILESFLQNTKSGSKREKREDRNDERHNEVGGGGGGGFDFETMANVASMFLGDNGNAEGLMGFLPILMQNFAGGNTDTSSEDYNGVKKSHDHSGHSWFLPPIIENVHIMWEHFSNSELGQTLWKNSGLANIVGTMMDSNGNLEYEKIFESFENPSLRRRWVRSLTNFVAEWISHISDPVIRQRYLATAQFVGNGFLKSQGYPKTAMFDPVKPAESLSKFVDATAKRYLNMKISSQKYVRPAVSYFQELVNLASEKGFIVSYISANELSNKLSSTLNNDFIEPIMTVYRSYKWGVKRPECATHIFCVINDKGVKGQQSLSENVTRFASYPAAWLLSNKIGINFWTLYGAVSESDNCFAKHPVDCTDYHEEEIRIKTESVHSEL